MYWSVLRSQHAEQVTQLEAFGIEHDVAELGAPCVVLFGALYTRYFRLFTHTHIIYIYRYIYMDNPALVLPNAVH